MNKKDIVYVVLMFVMMWATLAEAELKEMHIWGERIALDKPVVTEGPYLNELQRTETGRLKVLLYVYNDKTGLWDRAREETLKDITCDKLRGMNLPSGEEYRIEFPMNMKGE